MFKGVKNKFKVVVVTLTSMLLLTACGTELKNFVQTDIAERLNSRFDANKTIAKTLYENKFIDDTTYNHLITNIEKLRGEYITEDDKGNKVCDIKVDEYGYLQSGPILAAIREVRPLYASVDEPFQVEEAGKPKLITEIDGDNVTGDGLDTHIISNYLVSDLAWNVDNWVSLCNNTWVAATHSKNYKDGVNPIRILDSNSVIFENIDAEIYTLNPEITTADGTGGIDGVISIINECIDSNGNIINASKLNNYFSQATYVSDVKDSNGNVVHKAEEAVNLRDLINLNSLTGVSKPYFGESEVPVGEQGQTGNRPGYDLVCSQLSEPVIKISFEEFYQDAIDKFYVAMGIDSSDNKNTNKWLYYTDGVTTRVYLMEYPVYYVKGFQNYNGNNSKTEAILEESDLGLNLYTGNTIAYTRDSSGNIAAASVVKNNDVNYLPLAGALGINSESKSSYILSGIAETELSDDFGMINSSISVTTGRIILRDYLEATYAPGFNSQEDLVVLGRKIRLTNMVEVQKDFISSTQNSSGTSGAVTNNSNVNFITYENMNTEPLDTITGGTFKKVTGHDESGGLDYLLYVPETSGEPSLMLFLHGAGEKNVSLDEYASRADLFKYLENETFAPNCVMVFPILRNTNSWANVTDSLNKLTDYIIDEYNVDKDFVYLSGMSLGANNMTSVLKAIPDKFSSITFIAGITHGSTTNYTEYMNTSKGLRSFYFRDDAYIRDQWTSGGYGYSPSDITKIQRDFSGLNMQFACEKTGYNHTMKDLMDYVFLPSSIKMPDGKNCFDLLSKIGGNVGQWQNSSIMAVTAHEVLNAQNSFESWFNAFKTTSQVVTYVELHPYIMSITDLYKWYANNNACTSNEMYEYIKQNYCDAVDRMVPFPEEVTVNKSGFNLLDLAKNTRYTGVVNNSANTANTASSTKSDINKTTNNTDSNSVFTNELLEEDYKNLLTNPAFVIGTTNNKRPTIYDNSWSNLADSLASDKQNISKPVSGVDSNLNMLDINSIGVKTNSIINKNLSLKDNIPLEDISTKPAEFKDLKQTIITFDKSKSIAIFVDAEGNKIANTSNLMVTDFCDYERLMRGERIFRPTGKGEAASNGEARDASAKSANSLPWTSTHGSVICTTRFPGNAIGQSDYSIDCSEAIQNASTSTKMPEMHQVFYAMATSADLFSTSLFSSWVNVSSNTTGMQWWNDWLSINNYIYHLDASELEEYLYNNFKYELGQSGVVILDLNIIKKIQQEINGENQYNENKKIRTLFPVIGWLLIVYSFILIVAYLIDTNADLNYNILSIITFNKMVAVKYKSDIPPTDAEHRRYMTLTKLLIKCMIIITTGILLIVIDTFRLVLVFIQTFGELARLISELLEGI